MSQVVVEMRRIIMYRLIITANVKIRQDRSVVRVCPGVCRSRNSVLSRAARLVPSRFARIRA
jgi:hypothetical protein